jgi:hypothetical protein
MIRFRGHHLVCLHFFAGEGYSREFIYNLCHLLQGAGRGGEITVVEGADDVCRACSHLMENCCAHKPDSEREVRRLDEKALKYLAVKPGDRVKWQELRSKVISAPAGWLLSFCKDCDWEKLCRREQETKNPRDVAGNIVQPGE